MVYEDLLNIILIEKIKRKISIDKLSEMGRCHKRTMASYIHCERQMPVDVMLCCLDSLGYTIEVNK